MPFADKFRAMMELPLAGDTVGGLTVEEIDVRHDELGGGRIDYAVQMVLCGPGGVTGVQRTLRSAFPAHTMTFSGYGNPYQLWFGKWAIEPLGEGRYCVTNSACGARVHLEQELERFAAALADCGQLAGCTEPEERQATVARYLETYQGEIKRQVDRYRRRLRKTEGQASSDA